MLREEVDISTEEAIVLAIVLIVAVVWDVLIAYQIKRGETFAFSAQKWEAPSTRSRSANPRAFWLLIGMQAIFPNAAIIYLLTFVLASAG